MKAWALLAVLALATGKELPGPSSVAFAYRWEGTVRLAAVPGGTWEALTEARHLVPGARLETAAGATVSVVYWRSGRRYVLEPGSRARVTASGLERESGTVRALPEVGRRVKLTRLLDPGERPAAPIIRGEEGLAPTVVLADAAVLCLAPLPAGARVEIENDDERVVHRAEAAAPPVPIPARALRPGRFYTVRVSSPAGGWEELFTTLPRRQARARAALARAAARSGDVDLQFLLDRVDKELGLKDIKDCTDSLGGEQRSPRGLFVLLLSP